MRRSPWPRAGVGEVLTELTPIPNLSMVFLLAVLVTAVNFGIWPAIYASLLSFLVYNFFFIEPLYTFTVAEPYELLALVIFLVVAVDHVGVGRTRSRAGDRSRPPACGRCGGFTNSPAACRAWHRSMRWPRARPAKSTPALGALWLCCWSMTTIWA